MYGEAPKLDPATNAPRFTIQFVDFVNTCLIKEESQRPKYKQLLEEPFIKYSDQAKVDVADYVTYVLERWEQGDCEPHDVDMPSNM